MDHSILGEQVAIHDAFNSHGSGGKTQILQFDLAMPDLVVATNVIIENSDFEDHVVQSWDIVEDKRFVVHWISFVIFDRRSLKAVVMVTDKVVLLQVKTNVSISLTNSVGVSHIIDFFEENCKTAHGGLLLLLLVDMV
jgi:hypothetical protein